MSAQTIDPMAAAALWTALEPDGVTPSAEIAMQDDAAIFGYGADGVSARITASANATGHSLRRPLGPIDLTPYSELRLSLRADRAASGTEQPFFLQLRLGSPALPLDAAANTWHRLLPLRSPNRWETVKMGLDDLDAAIAPTVTQIELRCVDADPPFIAHVDDVTAVLPELVADADRGLEARLSGIAVGGVPAGAVVRSPAEAVPAAPALDILNVEVRFAPSRVRDLSEARDFTTGGAMRIVSLGDPYDLTYLVTPVAAGRADQAALVEAVTERLQPFDELVVDGDRLPVEHVWPPGPERIDGFPGPETVLYFTVGARRAAGAPQPVHEVVEVSVDSDYLEAP